MLPHYESGVHKLKFHRGFPEPPKYVPGIAVKVPHSKVIVLILDVLHMLSSLIQHPCDNSQSLAIEGPLNLTLNSFQ